MNHWMQESCWVELGGQKACWVKKKVLPLFIDLTFFWRLRSKTQIQVQRINCCAKRLKLQKRKRNNQSKDRRDPSERD